MLRCFRWDLSTDLNENVVQSAYREHFSHDHVGTGLDVSFFEELIEVEEQVQVTICRLNSRLHCQ